MSNYIVVSTLSTFLHHYVVPEEQLSEYEDKTEALKNLINDDLVDEFSQKHLGEEFVDSYLLDEESMLIIFDRYNDYLSKWTRDQKLAFVKKLKV